MKNPIAFIQTISHAKAIAFALFILGGSLVLSFALNIPATTINHITTLLKDAGFEKVEIGDVSYHGDGITAQSISLDPSGFDTIKTLDIKLSWPTFLFGKKVEEVKISGLSLTREAGDFKTVLQKSLMNLLELSDYRLVLENTILDMSTPFGALRFTVNATVDPPGENDDKKITAHIVADQYQLGFDSKWTGQIDKNGNLDMAADIVDGRMHFGPMNVTRFNGWMGLEAGEHGFTLQNQMDAGGADLFKIPMQNLSLVADTGSKGTTLMLRSIMAGMKDTTFAVDMAMTNDAQTFDIQLKGDHLNAFLERVRTERGHDRNLPAALNKDEPFQAGIFYQADRRFASGPLPFELDFTSGETKKLSGTFLIYPDVMDIRGSAETSKDMAKAMQTFFDINSQNMDGNFLRLDGNIGKMLGMEMPAAPVDTPASN